MAIPSLNIGGGKWATKQDKLLAYKQNIGGRYFAINGDTSRNSTATFTNQNGLIDSVGNNVARVDFQDDVKGSLLLEPQSTNLITQSESFGNSYWTKSGASIEGDPSTAGALVSSSDFSVGVDGYETARTVMSGNIDGILGVNDVLRFYANADANTHYVRAINKLIGNSLTYVTFDYYIPTSNTNVDGFNLLSGIGAFTSNNESFGVTGSWISASGFALGTSSTIQFRMTSGGNTSFSGANLITDDLVYLKNIVVREAVGFASPSLDSPMGAFKLVEGINTGGHLLQKVSSTSNGVIHTASVFVKYAGREWLRFTDAQSSNRVHFNTLTGLFGVVSGSVISYDSEALADGWYRLNIITTTVAAAYALRISLAEADNDVSYTGDGTSGIYIYGAQLEALPYATSYIPTSGSTVTRVQDVATDFGDVNTFNSEEGVLFVEMAALSDDLTQRFVAVSNGTSNNRLILGYDSFSNRVISFARVNGSLSFDIKVVITDIQNYNKLALRWKENDFSLWCNGLKIGEDLSGSSFPIGILDSFKFSDADGTTEIFKGKTKQVQVYKEALTDAQLITLTTI